MTEREQFEATFSAPPYEFRMERWGDRAAWAGNYKSYNTQCAWDGYQEARAALAQPVAAEGWQPRMTRAPTDQDLIDFAVAEEFLLFCDEEEFVQIGRGVLREFTEPPPTPA